MIAEQPGRAGRGARARSDALLQASRRLDWRFLLPDPSPGQILYIGPPRGSLLEALRLLDAPLTAVAGPGAVPAGAAFELAVAPAPTSEALQAAAGALKPGGHLYAEVHGPLAWKTRRKGAVGSARGAADALRRLGFSSVGLHWHWPSFESCTRILPLARWEALGYVAGASGERPAALRLAAARALLGSGLAAALAPHVSIVARR
ncbi:MAG TPA: hypothetical protein PKD53_27635 [Chloroflexaceae bacterium]|nr:hypothetical protein [Chloroflexaceae bacterium]